MDRILGLAAALLSVLLLLSVAALALLTWVSLDLDLTAYKARIVEEVESRTGLQLAVTGSLSLRLGPELGLQAQGVTLTRPTAAKTPLLKASSATLSIATLPLLHGRLEPRELVLSGADLDLTRNRRGRNLWDRQVPSHVAGLSADLDSVRLLMLRSRIRYRDLAANRTLRLDVDALEARRDGAVLNLALDGRLDGEPIRIGGQTAPLTQILAQGGKVLPMKLRGQLFGLDLSVDGTVALPGGKAQGKATLTLKAKTLAGLSPWLGQDVATLGPVDIRLVLSGGDGRYVLDPLSLQVGAAQADGRANLDLRGNRPALDLDLTLAELDLSPYLPEDNPQSISGTDRVFSTEPLDLGWMDIADVQAKVRVRSLTAYGRTLLDLDLTATLTDRHLTLDATGKPQGDRNLALAFLLNGRDPVPSLDLDLRGDKLQIAILLAGTGLENKISGDLDARAKVSAKGTTEAAMAASLSGEVLLLVEDIEAPVGSDLDRMGGAKTILGQILTPRSNMARIQCGLAALNFEGGETHIKGVIDTPNSIVTGEGSLNLGKETIDLRLVPQAKGVTLAVATPVLVSGPLANPTYRIEPGGVISSLSDIAARIAVPQLLLVDAFGQAMAGNSCGQILSGQIPSGPEYQLLEGLGKAVGTVIEAPGKVIEGVGQAVEKVGSAGKGPVGAVVKGAGGLVNGVGGLIKGISGAVKGAVDPGAQPAPEQ